MKEIPNHLSLAMMVTFPATFIPLILMKVRKATQADLNMSSIQ